MSTGSPEHDPRELRTEDNDPVWRLLSAAPRPAPDAWFTARTMARCRQERLVDAGMISLGRMWRWAIGGGLGVALAVVVLVTQIHSTVVMEPNKQKDVQDAFQILATVDTDPDSSSSSSSSSTSWQDSSL
jgi:hypothetical protein